MENMTKYPEWIDLSNWKELRYVELPHGKMCYRFFIGYKHIFKKGK